MRYIILGASAAGINAAKTIRELDNSSEIMMISSDNNIYSRCMLHHIIGNRRDVEGISFIEKDYFQKYNIQWLRGADVIEIKIDESLILLEGGGEERYDKLLIATGASAVIPPIKNLREAKGVYTLRNIEDALSIRESAAFIKEAVVIGAGLVGLDAAVGLMERGVKVTIIEMGDRILPLQLDERAAASYEGLLERHGATVLTGVSVSEAIINKDGFIGAVRLSNGAEICCEIAVVAAGVRPNIDFIKDKRIKIDKGIFVNDSCETSVDSIYAAGDVCGKAAIWPFAVKQGITAGFNMTGNFKEMSDYFSLKNSMNFLGLETISLGLINAPDESYTVYIFDRNNIYKKIIVKDGIIHGAILQNDVAYCGVLTQLIKNKVDISKIKKNIFNISYGDFYNVDDKGSYFYKY